MKTRTGEFAIGFRRGWSDWQKDLSRVIEWAKTSNLSVIDVAGDAGVVKQVTDAGLRIGSVDLVDWPALLSQDAGKRKAAVERNAELITKAAAAGGRNFFIVLLPEKADAPRPENFKLAVESMAALAPTLEKAKAAAVIEGWPGPGALCCTPEGYRAMLREVPSKAIAVNYDPSHLIRMGIDPLRFLREFGERVRHVHGKDTEILAENVYEYGTEQPATFTQPRFCGAWSWRYCIPGHGVMCWSEAFKILKKLGYQGAVSIELEDESFNGTEAGEKQGILAGARFLESC